MTVVVEDLSDFNLGTLRRVAWDKEPVELGIRALERMRVARADFLALLEAEPNLHIYGVTTGYDDAASSIVGPEERSRLVNRPVGMLAAGVGEPLPERVVRAMIFTRLINFVSGYTGLSLETAQQVASMLDGRPVPLVRLAGQDSQGELLQLINLFSGLDRANFQVRDANAIVNGSGCAPGLIGDAALRARRRTEIVTKTFCLSIDAALMGLDPYDTALKAMMGDEHEAAAIDTLSRLLQGAETTGRRSYQNPISWRIVARMLGHLFRTVSLAETTADSALCRVSDNPVFLGPTEAPPHGRVLSTGGFHNPGAYHAMNWLSATWADLAVLAARQAEKLHLNPVTGLPSNLVAAGFGAGTRFLPVSSHDLANRARESAIPALIPLYSGGGLQTDTVMPIFQAFEREDRSSRCLDLCIAILASCSSQALFVADREPAPALRSFLADVRDRFPPVTSARDLGSDTQRLGDDFSAAVTGEIAAFGLN
jgi:histidine ammonia-lyase